MSEWINVGISYPEFNINVLLTDGRTIGFGYRVQNERYPHWKSHQDFGWITHWMPLPKLPGGDEKPSNKIDYLIRTDGLLRNMIDALQKRVDKLEELAHRHLDANQWREAEIELLKPQLDFSKSREMIDRVLCKHPGPFTEILLSKPPKMRCEACGETFSLPQEIML